MLLLRAGAVLALAAPALAAPSSFCSAPGFAPEWADEFAGGALDEASWTVRTTSVYDDSSCRAAICSAANVAVRGGALALTARRENVEWANFTTGAVHSMGKRSWAARAGAPVRICVRGEVPVAGARAGSGDGLWPAFWLMPDDASCWPDHGEVDLMEMINGDGVEHFTYHVSPASAAPCHGGPVQLPRGNSTRVAPGAHEYAAEIALGRISFAVDGVVRLVVGEGGAALPVHDVPWYVILNFALGGPWPKNVTDATALPATTTVDYVRVARGGA